MLFSEAEGPLLVPLAYLCEPDEVGEHDGGEAAGAGFHASGFCFPQLSAARGPSRPDATLGFVVGTEPNREGAILFVPLGGRRDSPASGAGHHRDGKTRDDDGRYPR